VSALEKKKI